MRFLICALLTIPISRAAAISQIDSVKVDELQSEAVIYGSFSDLSNLSVFCDSISLSIVTTSSSQIRATIPSKGKGSCGPLWIEDAESSSNTHTISLWHFYNFYHKYRGYPSGGYEFEMNADSVYLRVDNLFLTQGGTLRVLPTKPSHYLQEAGGFDGQVYKYDGPVYRHSGPILDSFTISTTNQSIYDPKRAISLSLTDGWQIVSYNRSDSYCGNQGFGFCDHGGQAEPTRFPPLALSVKSVTSYRQMSIQMLRNTLNLKSESDQRYCIIDLMGREVGRGILYVGENRIDMYHLSPGYYQFISNDSSLTTRFLKLPL